MSESDRLAEEYRRDAEFFEHVAQTFRIALETLSADDKTLDGVCDDPFGDTKKQVAEIVKSIDNAAWDKYNER